MWNAWIDISLIGTCQAQVSHMNNFNNIKSWLNFKGQIKNTPNHNYFAWISQK